MVSAKDSSLQSRSTPVPPHSAYTDSLKEGKGSHGLIVEIEPEEVIFDEEEMTDSEEEIILQTRRLSLCNPPDHVNQGVCTEGAETSRSHRPRPEHAVTTPAGAPVDHLSSPSYSKPGAGGGGYQPPSKMQYNTTEANRLTAPSGPNAGVVQAIFRSQFLTEFTQRVLPAPFEKVPVQLVNQYAQEVARTVSNPQDPRARMLVKLHPNVVLYSQQCQLFDNHREDIEDRARRVARRTNQWRNLNQTGDPELAYQWLRGMDNGSSEQHRHKIAQKGSLQLRKCAVFKQASQVVQHKTASSS